MVCGCTVFGAAAQLLLKRGLVQLTPLDPNGGFLAWLQFGWGIVLNLPLIVGLVLYGLMAGLLVLALRYGELSVLYPIIALTYVWVSILSVLMLGESMNVYKILGLTIVVIGVAFLGRGEKKKPSV